MIYFICLFAAGVVIFPIYIITANIHMLTKHQDKLYQIAVSRGHEATATLKRSYEPSLEDPQNYLDRQQVGKYVFKYNGHTYKISMRFECDPPYEVKVYWLNIPKLAKRQGSIVGLIWPWLLAYFIVFFIALSIAT